MTWYQCSFCGERMPAFVTCCDPAAFNPDDEDDDLVRGD